MEEVIERHRKELKELKGKEMELKKAAAKGSKAEQKAKKKAVEEQVQKMEEEMKARHKLEIAEVSAGAEDGSEALLIATASLSVSSNAGDLPSWTIKESRPSRAQKRKEKRSLQDAEREARIEKEQDGLVSERMLEEERLLAKLKPLGLTLKEVKADGHCLYRAVEDQLRITGPAAASGGLDFRSLRAAAAKQLRLQEAHFMPFVSAEVAAGRDDETPAGLSSEILAELSNETDPEKQAFLKYCAEVEHTAAWGGHLELQALSQALRRPIVVFAADLPDLRLGDEYSSDGQATGGSSAPIRLSYHRHAFGLGEHYNSVIPYEAAAGGGADGAETEA